MFYVFGLGNPGDEYIKTRHNAGRAILGMLKDLDKFSEWKDNPKIKGSSATGILGKEKVIFIRPDTFMNNSGQSIRPVVNSKKDLAKVIVIYDDLDIPLGKIKISINKSAGGHNGLASIIKAVKSEEFVRIRVGIAKSTPKGKVKRPDGAQIRDFLVEKNFREDDIKELKKVSKKINEALEIIVTNGYQYAMNKFNQ